MNVSAQAGSVRERPRKKRCGGGRAVAWEWNTARGAHCRRMWVVRHLLWAESDACNTPSARGATGPARCMLAKSYFTPVSRSTMDLTAASCTPLRTWKSRPE